jgi:hypothetical protein
MIVLDGGSSSGAGSPAGAVRLLWEATEQALREGGMDTADVASLCDLVVRLADHRLLVAARRPGGPRDGEVAELESCRKQAAELLQFASAPRPDQDYEKLAADREKLEGRSEEPSPRG